MDILTDLSAHTVAYITLLQDSFRKQADPRSALPTERKELWTADRASLYEPPSEKRIERLQALLWYGNRKHKPEERARVLGKEFAGIAEALLVWLERHAAADQATTAFTYQAYSWQQKKPQADQLVNTLDFAPHQWRTAIRKLLCEKPEERTVLAGILHYMPVQVVLALGARRSDSYLLRLYQVWNPAEADELLCSSDLRDNRKWWDAMEGTASRRAQAAHLLENERDLNARLVASGTPLPFETMFTRELAEIEASRDQRIYGPETGFIKPEGGSKPDGPGLASGMGDPVEKAQRMQLTALAFSGGGIRSATFNLGVLQALAEKGLLQRFDYLSTVSGGGYIGSWLVSWIRQAGSTRKVAERLDPRKSADPMAEEVRPIRWLRMYSNYLTPNASIMSADSWTLGVTWLRNTLINFFMLLLLLCTCLSLVQLLFHTWHWMGIRSTSQHGTQVLGWSALFILPACLLAGLGMHLYNRDYPARHVMNRGKSRFFSLVFVGYNVFSALCIGTLLFTQRNSPLTFSGKLNILWPAAFVAFAGMLLIAILGFYHKAECSRQERRLVIPAILISSLISASLGVLLMAGVWELFQYLATLNTAAIGNRFPELGHLLQFTLGVPLILEVFSLVVVVRMAIMGRLFPDERREWWGKMGAIAHRFSLLWLVVCFAGLFLRDVFNEYVNEQSVPAWLGITGGWTAVVGYAVKLAYGAYKEKDSKSGFGIKEGFIRFAPYLFMIGFVLGGSALLTSIMSNFSVNYLYNYFDRKGVDWLSQGLSKLVEGNNILHYFVVTVLLAGLTYFLSWRIGVNEFSLHYFYRNRLVRAYLGAVRRRTDRERTANNFTGFDKQDDPKLRMFQTEEGYYGPYPLLNTALNATVVSELDRQDRKAEAFLFSPLYCGFDFSANRSTALSRGKGFEYGYRPTAQYGYEGGPSLGTAMAISGAAVNPNMGYHSSAATAFLLTIFNVRMGWWMGNPRSKKWKESDPKSGLGYIISDLVGKSNIDSDFVCLSDGGHFDNMGLYELVRRRCRYILLCDAEEDQGALCEGLANAIRRCRIDFGAEITLSTDELLKDKKTHYVTGTIRYAGEPKASGTLIYIKTVVTGDEPADVREYAQQNELFPNESTGDQFFDEAQFESYRMLGYHALQQVPLDLPLPAGSGANWNAGNGQQGQRPPKSVPDNWFVVQGRSLKRKGRRFPF